MQRVTWFLLVAALLGAGCSGDLPSEHEGYRIACEALAKDPAVPENARPAPFEEAGLYIAKNAGSVRLPYTFVNAAGETESASYTVWLKRVERVWQAERSYITPTYSTETP
jgi:hypothetical protein